MTLQFNQLLTDASINPADVRLLRHQTRLSGGKTPLDLFRAGRDAFDEYQSVQTHAQRANFRSPWWATFVGMHDGRTMFTGLYEVGEPRLLEQETHHPLAGITSAAGVDDYYALTLSPLLGDYVARLFIRWGTGSAHKAWRQRADLQDKVIVELHLDGASEPFPGLMKVVAPLSRIADAPPSWIDALSAARGVYMLTCPATDETYVGSATGTGGFWQRWMNYAADGHGGNIGLRERDRSDYRVSILQVAGSTDTYDDVIAMEMLWKRKLRTRHSLNRN